MGHTVSGIECSVSSVRYLMWYLELKGSEISTHACQYSDSET